MALIHDSDGTANLFDYLVTHLTSNGWQQIDTWNSDKYKTFRSAGTSGEENAYLILRQNASSQYNLDLSVAQTWNVISHSSSTESSHAKIIYTSTWKNWLSVDADRLAFFYESPGTPDYYGVHGGLLKRVTTVSEQPYPTEIGQLCTNPTGGLGSNVVKILLDSSGATDSACNLIFMTWDVVGQNDWDSRFLQCPIGVGGAITGDYNGDLKGLFSTYASSGSTMQVTMNDLEFTHFPYDGSTFSGRIYALLNK